MKFVCFGCVSETHDKDEMNHSVVPCVRNHFFLWGKNCDVCDSPLRWIYYVCYRFRKNSGRCSCRPSWQTTRLPCLTRSAPLTFTCPWDLCCEMSVRLWVAPVGRGYCRKWEHSRLIYSVVATNSSSRTAFADCRSLVNVIAFFPARLLSPPLLLSCLYLL